MVFCICLRLCLNPGCIIFAVTFCVIGVVSAVGVTYWYYTKFFPTAPTASLEHTGMYDYMHDYDSILKRNLHNEDSRNREEYDYYSDKKEEEMEDYDIFRDKRNLTSSSTTDNGGKQAQNGGNATTIVTPKSKGKSKGQQTTSSPTKETVDDEPGFEASNKFLDSVFSHSDKENITDSLGLCRRGTEVKMPVQFKATYFPAEEATGIMNCINDILQNETKKQVCVQLDEELNAYLRWLVLTGQPKEKQRSPNVLLKDDFLFPAIPCASPGNAEEGDSQPTTKCSVGQELGQVSDSKHVNGSSQNLK